MDHARVLAAIVTGALAASAASAGIEHAHTGGLASLTGLTYDADGAVVAEDLGELSVDVRNANTPANPFDMTRSVDSRSDGAGGFGSARVVSSKDALGTSTAVSLAGSRVDAAGRLGHFDTTGSIQTEIMLDSATAFEFSLSAAFTGDDFAGVPMLAVVSVFAEGVGGLGEIRLDPDAMPGEPAASLTFEHVVSTRLLIDIQWAIALPRDGAADAFDLAELRADARVIPAPAGLLAAAPMGLLAARRRR